MRRLVVLVEQEGVVAYFRRKRASRAGDLQSLLKGWDAALPAEVKVEEIGPCKKRLKIQVPKEDLAETLEKTYAELMTAVALPGFRRGRVPRKLVEKRFGDDVKADVKQKAMSESFRDAIEKNELIPVGEPQYDNVEFDVEKALSFEVTFEVLPTFDPPTYKSIKLNRKSAEPTEEDVYNTMQEMRRRAAVLTTVDGAAEKGDIAICDYAVRVNDQNVASAGNAEIAADGMNVVGIPPEPVAKLLIGAKAGEKRSDRMKLTNQFAREDLRGKDAEVRFDVKEIKRAIMPEVDDEFAKKRGFDSVKEMQDHVRESVKARKEEWVKADLERQTCDSLLAAVNFELPLDLLKRQTEENLLRQKIRLMMRGISAEQIDREEQKLRAMSEEDATRDFKVYLILDKIAEKEKVFATEDDVEQRIVQMAMRRGVTPIQLRQRIETERGMSSLRSEIRHQKVLDLLVKSAQIIDVKKSITAGPEEEEEKADVPAAPPAEEKKRLILTPEEAAREGRSNEEQK